MIRLLQLAVLGLILGWMFGFREYELEKTRLNTFKEALEITYDIVNQRSHVVDSNKFYPDSEILIMVAQDLEGREIFKIIRDTIATLIKQNADTFPAQLKGKF